MKLGDKVYVGHAWGWNSVRYLSGEVVKITRSGLVDVKFRDDTVRFVKNKYRDEYTQLGQRRRGFWIDVNKTYDERTASLALQERLERARVALAEVTTVAGTFERFSYLDLFNEVNRLQALLDNARKLVREVC